MLVAVAIQHLGAQIANGGQSLIGAAELSKTPQGFLIAPTVSREIDAALEDALVCIETERFEESKP